MEVYTHVYMYMYVRSQRLFANLQGLNATTTNHQSHPDQPPTIDDIITHPPTNQSTDTPPPPPPTTTPPPQSLTHHQSHLPAHPPPSLTSNGDSGIVRAADVVPAEVQTHQTPIRVVSHRHSSHCEHARHCRQGQVGRVANDNTTGAGCLHQKGAAWIDSSLPDYHFGHAHWHAP